MLRVCSFFTNAKYKKLVTQMETSVKPFGYPVSIHEMPHHADPETAWGINLRHKPEVVLRTMDAYPEDDVLYMDADCEMMAVPELLFRHRDADVALNFIRPKHPHGCVLYFKAKARGEYGYKVAKDWKDSYELYPHIRLDEIHFYYSLKANQGLPGFHLLSLPFSYTWVTWTAGHAYPGAKPIIRHHGEGRGPDKSVVLQEAKFHLPI